MYLPSLPTIEIELAGEPGVGQLTLSAFFVGLAVGQLIYGPASDVLGRRKVLIWGIILYCLGGLACVFVETIEQLIFARLTQALGAAVGGVIARAIIRDLFSLDKAAQAQSFINLAFSITPLLAPTIGGYLLILFGWRSIFLFDVGEVFGPVSIRESTFWVEMFMCPLKGEIGKSQNIENELILNGSGGSQKMEFWLKLSI